MNPTLTVSTKTFTLSYSDKTGSLRRDVSKGINQPQNLIIKHQSYIDSQTKRPGSQSALILESVIPLADGTVAVGSRLTCKVQTLTDTAVVAGDVSNLITLLVDILSSDGSHLNMGSNIFVNKEQ